MPAAKSASKATKKDTKEGKKRVRVVEPEEEVEQVVPAVEPVEKKKSKKGKKDSVGAVEADTSRRDLKEKDPSTIKEIVSAEAPLPGKSLLKPSPDKKKKATAAPVVVEAEVEEDKDDDEEEEEIDFLKGFEESDDDGQDSSDDDDEEMEATFKIEELPKVKGEDAAVQKKLEAKAERKKNAKTGTIYLGRIPHGFHEEEMKSYFSQFGEVTRLRLSRNKSTGASKHYAFIEFAYASVAQIVQETMDNYLLAGHILVCKVVPDNEIHPKLWIGANRKFRPVPKGRKDKIKRETPKTDQQKKAIKSRLLKRENAKREKLAALGIEYDFPGFANKAVAVEDVEDAQPAKDEVAKKEKSKKKKAPKSTEEPAKKKARKST